MSEREHCPACGSAVSAGGLGLDEYCSDACALRSSDEVFEALEGAIAKLAPQISRESFTDAMTRLADDLGLRQEHRLQARPLRKAVARSAPSGPSAGELTPWARAVGLKGKQ